MKKNGKILYVFFCSIIISMCKSKTLSEANIPKVEISLGSDLADDYVRKGLEEFKIDEKLKKSKLVELLNIKVEKIGRYYGAGDESRFALIIIREGKTILICYINRKDGVQIKEDSVIEFKKGDLLEIVQVSV